MLDIAAGTGALALAAAHEGARLMDGQALDLPDASFDPAFSIFGIFLFPHWRAGLTEMAGILKPGGTAVVASWQGAFGAGPNILLNEAVDALSLDPVTFYKRADCVCVSTNKAIEAEGRIFCSDTCASHHESEVGCEHAGCICHG